MKKLGYVIAALGALIIAAPSIASAETIVIKRGGGGGYHGHHHDRGGARAEFRGHRDRGYHRGSRHGDKVVIIKKHRY
jgi:hypothetical protein